MSESQLRARLRQAGLKLRQLVSQRRVRRAAELIALGWKIESAMREVGLSNRTSFCEQCRKAFRCAPSDLRQ